VSLGLPPPLLRCDSGVRALTLRDGVSDVLCSRGCPAVLWLGARLCWEMALRCETLSKLASGNSVAEESPSVRAEGCPRTRFVPASACKTLAIGKQAGSTAKARFATLRGVQSMAT